MGYIAGRLLVWAEAKQSIEKQSFLAYTLAISLFFLGFVKLVGSDRILAVFVAGIAFDLVVGGSDRAEEENVQEAVDRFFTIYIFVILGLALPWQQWLELGWKGLLLAVAVLLLRHPSAFLVLRPLLGQLKSWQDTLFLGWFGPISATAIFYAMLALHKTGLESAWVIGSLIICASIIPHGFTAVPLAKAYGKMQRKRQTFNDLVDEQPQPGRKTSHRTRAKRDFPTARRLAGNSHAAAGICVASPIYY
jgi:NhaP-type Na+/H+ or K+/H+ antiporter